MSERFDDDVAALLRKHKKALEVNGQADERESAEQQDFLSAFRDKAQNTIRPVLESTERKVVAAQTDIKVRTDVSNAKAELTAWAGAAAPFYKLVFAPDFERKRVTATTMFPSLTRPTATIKVEEVSEEFVEKQVLDFLAKVMERA